MRDGIYITVLDALGVVDRGRLIVHAGRARGAIDLPGLDEFFVDACRRCTATVSIEDPIGTGAPGVLSRRMAVRLSGTVTETGFVATGLGPEAMPVELRGDWSGPIDDAGD